MPANRCNGVTLGPNTNRIAVDEHSGRRVNGNVTYR